MENSIEYSVVVPVYNGEKFVSACLSNILNQTFRDLELIVVDDGSTDQTPALVKSFQDIRLRYVRMEHGGAIKARQEGVRLSQSEWVAFCDHDDMWEPNKLAVQIESIESYDLIYTEAFIFKNNKILGLYSDWLKTCPSSGGAELLPNFFMRNPIVNSTVLLKKYWALFSFSIPLDPKVCLDVDYSLWLELLSKGAQFKYISEPLVDYRFHEGQQTAGRWRLRLWRKYVLIEFLRAHPTFKKNHPFLVRHKLFRTYLGLAVSGWQTKDFYMSGSSFVNAIKCFFLSA
jgi:glycosyltransferase involved in cell wall biosynthesis